LGLAIAARATTVVAAAALTGAMTAASGSLLLDSGVWCFCFVARVRQLAVFPFKKKAIHEIIANLMWLQIVCSR